MSLASFRSTPVLLLLAGLAATAAAAARWRRQARTVSTAELDERVAELSACLAFADHDPEIGVSGWMVMRHRTPPVPDRPWFWWVGRVCPDFQGPLNAVHDDHGYQPSRRAAERAVHDAIERLHHAPTSSED